MSNKGYMVQGLGDSRTVQEYFEGQGLKVIFGERARYHTVSLLATCLIGHHQRR